MPTVFVTHCRVAGLAEQVAAFDAFAASDEHESPSDRFERSVAATDASGNPVAIEYTAVRRRYRPVLANTCQSDDVAKLGILSLVVTESEQGETALGVYLGATAHLANAGFNAHAEDVDGSEVVRGAKALFVRLAQERFGLTVFQPPVDTSAPNTLRIPLTPGERAAAPAQSSQANPKDQQC